MHMAMEDLKDAVDHVEDAAVFAIRRGLAMVYRDHDHTLTGLLERVSLKPQPMRTSDITYAHGRSTRLSCVKQGGCLIVTGATHP